MKSEEKEDFEFGGERNMRPHPSHQVPADLSHMWLVIAISNTPRYRRRYELLWPFLEMVKNASINHVLVEMQLGDREFMVTQHGNPHHVRIRGDDEFWHKENLQNLGWVRAMELDPKIREVMFCDADLRPMHHPRAWFEECWHTVQHYVAAQCFEYIMNLDWESNPLTGPRRSFMGSYCRGARKMPVFRGQGLDQSKNSEDSGAFWLGSPGGAWIWRHDALMQVGGLLDTPILGSADWHMAQGLLGFLEPVEGEHWHQDYAQSLYNWQERALRWIKKDVGFVPGGVLHDNHGPQMYRYYVNRKMILVENEFQPTKDLKRGPNGLYQLETWDPRQINMRDDVRDYFRARMEDLQEFRQLNK